MLRRIALMAGSTVFGTSIAHGVSVAWNTPITASTQNFAYGMDLDRAAGRVYVTGENAAVNARLDAFTALNGVALWGKPLTNPANGIGIGVAVRSDGGVNVVGTTHFAINGVSGPGGENTFVGRYAGPTGAHQQTVELSSNGDDYPTGVAVDAADNSYVSGFSSGPIGAPIVGGAHDAFLAKHNAAGTLQWIRKAGTTELDVGRATTVDRTGNVYLAGETAGVLVGRASLGGTQDGFVQKYDPAGNLLWQRHVGTNLFDSLSAVAVDPLDNVVTATVAFPTIAGRSTVQMRDPSGALLWSRDYGTAAAGMNVRDIAIDDSGHIFIAGINTGSLGGTPSAGGLDAFIAQLGPTGDLMWTYQFGTAGADQITSLVSDGFGSLYAAGHSERIGTSGNVPGFVMRIDVPEPTAIGLMSVAAMLFSRRLRG